ncbi:glutathione S-transferase family protein [Ramlibacter humi]|uniref:Glutathione S-transferase family protein n=1 Tax=Ramlibacter humi TaxID=2530451 RepID=A0A4Z0CA57_9BURK|nr:glutathione S-transferase family protein [Ramlibacter humi]TFZ08221.1 glutathione S-transferase family protein [Ramlibacter humi]
MDAGLILHHYPESPFSEKVRLILGYKQLPWSSVRVPPVQPKPDVVALTGGYRRTPFLQVGADVYCDTALIADVLEHVKPEPTLYPPHLKGVARVFSQWADSTLFWAAMTYSIQPKSGGTVFSDEAQAQAFIADRKAMRTNMTQLRVGDATSAYRSYLRRIANMADEHDFLFGAEPCIADFAAYHPLWFTRVRAPAMAGILQPTPSLLEWMQRMDALGHGLHERMSAAEAIEMAAKVEPKPPGQNLLVDSAFQDDHGIPLGTRVTIAAEAFGPEATEGELMAATRTHYTLRRTDPRAGAVHVHFPRIGYVLRKAESA